MKTTASIISGFAGAAALTLLHELVKNRVTKAPRLDKLGKQGLEKMYSAAGIDLPSDDVVEEITLGGDIISNAGYYSMVALKPKYGIITGAALGLAAGIGAVALPGELGMNESYSGKTGKTKVLTILLYLAGGLVAGTVSQLMDKRKN